MEEFCTGQASGNQMSALWTARTIKALTLEEDAGCKPPEMKMRRDVKHGRPKRP